MFSVSGATDQQQAPLLTAASPAWSLLDIGNVVSVGYRLFLTVCLQSQDMAQGNHEGTEADTENTDELLYTGQRFCSLFISHSI